jgi:hypothetical protein
MAKSKISNTLPSSNKKLNRQLVTGQIAAPKTPAAHLVTTAPSTTTPEQRKEIAREILLEISSYSWPKAERPDPRASPFLWGATQVNVDLAVAADCEVREDIFLEDGDFFGLLSSPMYARLIEAFMEDAMQGDSCALLNVVWRAYKAGLASPNRLIPEEIRQERRQQERESKAHREKKAGELLAMTI